MVTDLERAPVVTIHDEPQPSPQEWPCGCVTATYVTDRDALAGGRPFEMRLVTRCARGRCAIRREALHAVMGRFDLLPSSDWPFTTERLLAAYVALQQERR
jgi:hypothetical protein